MDRRKRPAVARDRVDSCARGRLLRGAVLPLALFVAGCGGDYYLSASSGSPPVTGVPSSGTTYARANTSTSLFGNVLAIGMMLGISSGSDRGLDGSGRVPGLDPSRRVLEQDCTKPIEDWSANLKCK